MDMDIAGKRVLITGGGSGIGEGIVEGFARQGADVTFFDICGEAPSVAERTGARFVHTDLTDIASVKAATPPEAEAQAARIAAMLPPARITEVMHEVSRATGFAAAFTNIRTGEHCGQRERAAGGDPRRGSPT